MISRWGFKCKGRGGYGWLGLMEVLSVFSQADVDSVSLVSHSTQTPRLANDFSPSAFLRSLDLSSLISLIATMRDGEFAS